MKLIQSYTSDSKQINLYHDNGKFIAKEVGPQKEFPIASTNRSEDLILLLIKLYNNLEVLR